MFVTKYKIQYLKLVICCRRPDGVDLRQKFLSQRVSEHSCIRKVGNNFNMLTRSANKRKFVLNIQKHLLIISIIFVRHFHYLRLRTIIYSCFCETRLSVAAYSSEPRKLPRNCRTNSTRLAEAGSSRLGLTNGLNGLNSAPFGPPSGKHWRDGSIARYLPLTE